MTTTTITTHEDVRSWLEQTPLNATPVLLDWNQKIWKQPYAEIIEHLEDVHNTTISEIEYYTTKLYLTKALPKKSLYIPFHESPQYVELLDSYFRGYKDTIEKKNYCSPHRCCGKLCRYCA